MTHFHCTVIAHDGIINKKLNYLNATSVFFLTFDSEEQAVEMAKNFVKRKFYHLQSINQCNTCRFQENVTSALKKMHE